MLSPANLRRVLDRSRSLMSGVPITRFPTTSRFGLWMPSWLAHSRARSTTEQRTQAGVSRRWTQLVDALAERVAAESIEALFEEHRQFALSHGTLEERLAEVLHRDDG